LRSGVLFFVQSGAIFPVDNSYAPGHLAVKSSFISGLFRPFRYRFLFNFMPRPDRLMT